MSRKRFVLKVTDMGGGLGVFLSQDALKQLGVQKGEPLFGVQTSRGIEFSAHPLPYTYEEAMEVARRLMDEHAELLRMLADS